MRWRLHRDAEGIEISGLLKHIVNIWHSEIVLLDKGTHIKPAARYE
jgi:hypothetical protein